MFNSPVYEDQPLVPTNQESGKFDIDSFLIDAKKLQKNWFIISTIFSTLSLIYSIFLLTQYPSKLFAQNGASINGTVPLDTCTPHNGAGSTMSIINICIAIIPVVFWLDQLRSYLKPAPSNGPSVIVFKPYYIRPTQSDNITTPEEYFKYINNRSSNLIQSSALGITFFSLCGLILTLFFPPITQFCAETNLSLRLPFFLGIGIFGGLFMSVLIGMIYKHKQNVQNSFGSTQISLDSYHPL
jgi:hypothetical protein